MIPAFIQLVKDNLRPNFRMAEIGVWQGESTIHYLPEVQKVNGKGYLVDWFKGNKNAVGMHAFNPQSDALYHLVKNLQYARCFESSIILNGPSAEMSTFIPDLSLDLVFIDADHAYSSVKRDIALYRHKLRPGGILAGHDFDRMPNREHSPEELEQDMVDGYHAGVTAAVVEAFPLGFERMTDSIWWVKL